MKKGKEIKKRRKNKMKKYDSCEERIDESLKDRIEELAYALNGQYGEAMGDTTAEFEDFIDFINSYALAWEDDPEYRAKRLLLSWGGPSEYFLFFDNGNIEYHYVDWGDSAVRSLSGYDYNIMQQVKEYLTC